MSSLQSERLQGQAERSPLDNVLLWTCPGATKTTQLTGRDVSKVEELIHSRHTSLEEIQEALRQHSSASAGLARQTSGRASSGSSSALGEVAASCRPKQIPAVLATMGSRENLRQRVAWDFRALDEECTGRLALHRCVVLFSSSLGSRFSRRVWSEFRALQMQQQEAVGDLGGACLDDVRTVVLHALGERADERGLSRDEVQQLVESEREAGRAQGLKVYRSLKEGMLGLDADLEELQRLATSQDLIDAAKRRLADFRRLAMPEADDEDLFAGGDEADAGPSVSFRGGFNLDVSRSSVVSFQSGESSFAQEKRRLERARSVWEALEGKYDLLSRKLLVSTRPVGEVAPAAADVERLHGDVVRLLRAGRLSETDKLLAGHRDTPDVAMLFGPVDRRRHMAAQLAASPDDFLPVSPAGRSLAELHLRQSGERGYLTERIEAKHGGVSADTLCRRLQLHKAVAEAEDGFQASVLLLGLQERAHRPGTLSKFQSDRVRCQQLARLRLPGLLQAADLFRDFGVLSQRLAEEVPSPSASDLADRVGLEDLVLQLLQRKHAAERSTLVWLMEHTSQTDAELSSLPALVDTIARLSANLSQITAKRQTWLDASSSQDASESAMQHQAFLSQAAQLARENAWRWCHDAMDMIAMTPGVGTALSTEGREAVKNSCPEQLLLELLVNLQELQLEELESTMAEAASKDASDLHDLVIGMHSSLLSVEVDNVASVLLRPPISADQFRAELAKTTTLVKYRTLQDVFFLEALAFGDGTSSSQKEWSALTTAEKQAEFVSLKLEDLAERRDDGSAHELRKVDTSYHQGAKASLTAFMPKKKRAKTHSVPVILEEMCCAALESVPGPKVCPVDKLMPAAVQALLLLAPSFGDAVRIACGNDEPWSVGGSALPWQLVYAGRERLQVLNVDRRFSDTLPYMAAPREVLAEACANRALVALLVRQAHERSTLASLIPTVLQLSTVWKEVTAMDTTELKARLQELSGGSVVFWGQNEKSRTLLKAYDTQFSQEACVTLLQLLQDDTPGNKEGDGRKEAVSNLWKLCFKAHAGELRQALHWTHANSTSVEAVALVLAFFEHLLKKFESKHRTLSAIDDALFWFEGRIADPYARMSRILGVKLELSAITMLHDRSSSDTMPVIVRAITSCPERKILQIRHQFLELVTRQYASDGKQSTVSQGDVGPVVMDKAGIVMALEQSLDAIKNIQISDEVADVLALHPGAEDSFQELCWLMAELGLMPEQKERAGEMDRTAAAVSVVRTLARLAETRASQMRRWSLAVSNQSSGGGGDGAGSALRTLQSALAYQLFVLDVTDDARRSGGDINTALLLVMIKSMMSLRMTYGAGQSAVISYSNDWYYHNQLLAQRQVQLWQTRQCLALTYDAELTELVKQERAAVQNFLTDVASKARHAVGSHVTLVQELFNQLHCLHLIEVQVLLLILQLTDLDRPGLEELTEKPVEFLQGELQRLKQDHQKWISQHAPRSLGRVQSSIHALSQAGDFSDTQRDDDEGLGILLEAAIMRVVLTMWQIEEREAKGIGNSSYEDDPEPMSVLLLRQLASRQQQSEDNLLRQTVDMDAEALRSKICESLNDRVACNWPTLTEVLFSSNNYSETVARDASSGVLGSGQEPAGVGRFSRGVKLYRLSTTDLYGALDTSLQAKMRKKSRQVRRRRSGKLSQQQLSPVAGDTASTGELKEEEEDEVETGDSTLERTKEFNDQHRLIMADLLTTYNKLRDAKLKKPRAPSVGGLKKKKKSVQFGGVEVDSGKGGDATDAAERRTSRTLHSPKVARRLEERKASRQRASATETPLVQAESAGGGDDVIAAPGVGNDPSDENDAFDDDDEEGDDVDLPELSGDSLTDGSGGESEQDAFRPLTAWARPKTGTRRATSSLGSRPSAGSLGSGGASRPLSRLEESTLNRVDGAASPESTVDDTDLQREQQQLRAKTAVERQQDAEPPAGNALVVRRTSSLTRDMADKERERQKDLRQQALKRKREQIASRSRTPSASVSPLQEMEKTSSPTSTTTTPDSGDAAAMVAKETGGEGSSNLTEFEALADTITTRLEKEKGRQLKQQRGRTVDLPEHGAA